MQSCKDESFYNGDIVLEFSLDTLRFDTVFTQLGSATRFVKVFNPHSERVLVNAFEIESGSNSFFRMNIDGVSGRRIENVEINANDSTYIFIETTIDPDNPLSVSPFIIEDRILVNHGSQEQDINLEAWGQNANYIPDQFSQGGATLLPCDINPVVWDDPKPYVIYGILLIDDCTLVWPPGTEIYVHGGVVSNDLGIYNDGLILVGENGNLIANGTPTDTVFVQGDRLEESFQDDSGQWQGVRFLAESKNNKLSYTTIKNSIFGVWADSLAEVSLDHSQMLNTSSWGVVGIHAEVNMSNCLVHSNGNHSVQFSYGGNYVIDYSTIASYFDDKSSIRLDNYLCRDQFCSEVSDNPLNFSINNSILMGSDVDELILDDISNGTPGMFEFEMQNCIVRVDTLLTTPRFANFFDHCIGCINFNTSDSDTLFVDVDNLNFKLDTGSIAEQAAIPLTNILDDLEGNIRDTQTPDIGCYEFQ